ncbi:MAG TPA: cell envelope integrity protein CreD, partial [Chitinophaga sp.]
METNYNPPKVSLIQRYGYAIKAVIIGVLTLVLMIPTALIMGLIEEREQMQDKATAEVSAKWANAQTITGPVLVVPYTTLNGQNNEQVIRYACFLPDKLSIKGALIPEIRKRGIYEVAVYDSRLEIHGSFAAPDLAALNIPSSALHWNEAFLTVGVSDMRGIGYQTATWNSQEFVFNPGTPPGGLLESGIQAKIPLTVSSDTTSTGPGLGSFTILFAMRGSGKMYFSPVGKTTQVELQAKWPSPSFDGAFLPATRTVKDSGFSARWEVSHLNRSFPQSWTIGDKYKIHDADFGVNLFLPVDGYQKSMRAIKYAILIIGLTFLLFYFIELLQHYPVHPLQYILIGIALCIFYTLLIALAEQLSFNVAYAIAASLTLGLVTVYARSVFRKASTALAVGGTLLT